VPTIKLRVDQLTNAFGRMYMYYIPCRIPSYERNDGCDVELQCSEFLSDISRKGAYHYTTGRPIH
jgi:hypothetical protein